MMKKIIGIAIGLILFTATTKGQFDAKFNAIGLILKGYGIGVDYAFKEDVSIGVAGNFSEYFIGVGSGENFTSFNVAPELRYYVSPRTEADGFFVGGYVKYANVSYDRARADIFVINESGYWQTEERTYDLKLQGLAVGFGSGYKWAFGSGFMMEIHYGFGRYLTRDITYSDNEVREHFRDDDDFTGEELLEVLYEFDFRLGFNLGFRF